MFRRSLPATLCLYAATAQAPFAPAPPHTIAITLTAENRAKLREKPREWVPAQATIDGQQFASIAVKLKGAAGSFQEIDQRPGLTVRFDKPNKQQRWQGQAKIHLNNCAQDDTALCEWLGAQVFAAAGYPAPRVGHAVLALDGKSLGLYVLREAFDATFLASRWRTEDGNLYEGGFCQDLDAELEKDAGDGPDDRQDLARVVAACRKGRGGELAQLLDMRALIDFIALEAMLGHWDGYSQNRNNYRLWLPRRGAGRFLPHGMDQLFGDPNASILGWPQAMVASAALEQPSHRKRYRERLTQLLPLFAPAVLIPDLDAVAKAIHDALLPIDKAAAEAHAGAVEGLRNRIRERYVSLRAQVAAPEPKPLTIAKDKPWQVRTFNPAGESEGIKLSAVRLDQADTLAIACVSPGEQSGAWRTTLLLSRGRYRFSAKARATDVVAPAAGEDGSVGGGVSLAVGDARSDRLYGTKGWQVLTCEFEIGEFQREIEFAARLRGRGGKAWFRLDGFELRRLD